MIEVSGEVSLEPGKRHRPRPKMRTAIPYARRSVVDPRTAPDDVWNLGKEVVETLSTLIHAHRNFDTASDETVLRQVAVRIPPTASDAVAVSCGEGVDASIEHRQMLPEAFVIFDRRERHGLR